MLHPCLTSKNVTLKGDWFKIHTLHYSKGHHSNSLLLVQLSIVWFCQFSFHLTTVDCNKLFPWPFLKNTFSFSTLPCCAASTNSSVMATSTRGDARGGLGHVVFSSDQMWSCRFNWCIYIINKTTYTKTHWIGIISLNFEEYFSSLSSHNLICWCWHLPYGTCLIALYLRLQTSCILASSKSRLRQIPTKSIKSYCWAQLLYARLCKDSRQHILSFVLPWYHLLICTRLRRNGRRKKCKGELGNIVFQEWEKAMYHTWDWNMKGNSCMWLQHNQRKFSSENADIRTTSQ